MNCSPCSVLLTFWISLSGPKWKHSLTLTLMIQDSGPFSHRTMFRVSKLILIGLGGHGANQIIIVTKLRLASVLSQFRLGILGRTLKVALPSACPVFS